MPFPIIFSPTKTMVRAPIPTLSAYNAAINLVTIDSRAQRCVNLLVWIVLSVALIACSSFLRIALYPVPVTLQTFAVSLLMLFDSKKACYSALTYLLLASLGAPIVTYPAIWFWKPTAGYLLALPLGALLGMRWLPKATTWLGKLLVLSLTHAITLSLGALVLSCHVGLMPALKMGFYPFIIAEGIKILFALNLFSLTGCRFVRTHY